jgi:hypothetical protein
MLGERQPEGKSKEQSKEDKYKMLKDIKKEQADNLT